MLKLDLGSGDNPMVGEDWTTVDLYEPADWQCDVRDLPCEPGSVDVIRAYHILEHLPLPWLTLTHWAYMLRPGGTLQLEVPDLDGACRLWLTGFEPDRAHELIYGSQLSNGQFHCSGFGAVKLHDVVVDAGFEDCKVEHVTSYGAPALRLETTRG